VIRPYRELAGSFDPVAGTLTLLPEGERVSRPVACRIAGRIFNVESLRQRHSLRGAEVEEVVAALYDRLGVAAVAELDGMFTLALWDSERGRGVLAQDKLGVCSLFYAAAGRRLCFASDVRDLLQLLPTTPPPDEVALAHALVNSEPSPERTYYEGVGRLCAAHLLELDGSGWHRRRYWRPRYRTPLRGSPRELSQLLWETVNRAVERRLADGGRPGLIMSGGIDSSTVAAATIATAVERLPRGYSAVFPGNDQMDESSRIGTLSAALGLESMQFEILPSGGVHAVLDYLRTWSVPAPGPGVVLEKPLAERAAADGIEVLLDGQGGDEVFGFSPYLLADRIRRGRLLSSLRLARRFPLALEHPPWRQSIAMWRMFGLGPSRPLSLVDRADRKRRAGGPPLLQPRPAQLFLQTVDPFAWRRDADGPLWWAFKAELLVRGREHTRLSEYLRHRAAEAGLEARPPLMDQELVDLSLSLPPEPHFDARFDRPLIREAIRLGGVPDEVRFHRRKSDLGSFYYRLNVLADFRFIRDLLTGPGAYVREYLTQSTLDELRDLSPPGKHGGNRYLGTRLWNFVVVETFLRQLDDSSFAEKTLESAKISRPSSRLCLEQRPSSSSEASVELA
jgi:asparagine synthase (glutamine-hydrolysing)